jgi:hypothetical protein
MPIKNSLENSLERQGYRCILLGSFSQQEGQWKTFKYLTSTRN